MMIFKKNMINLYGDSGKEWLLSLSDLIVHKARLYDLSDLVVLENMTYHYIVSGLQYKTRPVIMKLGFDQKVLAQEAAALQYFNGEGTVKLLFFDNEMLLLEHLIPGVTLASYVFDREQESLLIAAHLMKKLHSIAIPKNNQFPEMQKWLEMLNESWDIPACYLLKARLLANKLLHSIEILSFLHGDLHHDNILQKGNQWLAVDPKGVIGDLASEIAVFIRNPMEALYSFLSGDPIKQRELESILVNRILFFSSHFKIDKYRLLEWCFVDAVLCWTWAQEDRADEWFFAALTKVYDQLSI